MRMYDLIIKKRDGGTHTKEEIEYIVDGFTKGCIPDYQMSAWLMSLYYKGMTKDETVWMTMAMADSGDRLDLSRIEGVKVDKHSTGGVGDKTTLVIAPIVASCGVPVIKMSGRGLGYTGGTIDKLESIPGYRIDLSDDELIKQVHDIGIVVTGQTGDLVPMDKVIYALRDVTATVSSIPLIASSIMSKKIAGGADKILIDIKVGDGALLGTKEEAKKLATIMKKIGKVYNREVQCVVSDMNIPLGTSVGNSLEVLEAIDVLYGKEDNNNFVDLCIELATDMVSMGKEITREEAGVLVRESLKSGAAYNKFLELVKKQGGDLSRLKVSNKKCVIKSPNSGIVKKIDALEVGKLSLALGSGKVSIKDKIDYTVGVKLKKLVGDSVKKGDVLAELYYNKKMPDFDVDKIFKIN